MRRRLLGGEKRTVLTDFRTHIFLSLPFSAISLTFASIEFFLTLCSRSSWKIASTSRMMLPVARVLILLMRAGK